MMDRRNFIGSLLALGAGFTILPSIPGGRIWKALPSRLSIVVQIDPTMLRL